MSAPIEIVPERPFEDGVEAGRAFTKSRLSMRVRVVAYRDALRLASGNNQAGAGIQC